jgi:hypothetical protein
MNSECLPSSYRPSANTISKRKERRIAPTIRRTRVACRVCFRIRRGGIPHPMAPTSSRGKPEKRARLPYHKALSCAKGCRSRRARVAIMREEPCMARRKVRVARTVLSRSHRALDCHGDRGCPIVRYRPRTTRCGWGPRIGSGSGFFHYGLRKKLDSLEIRSNIVL